MNSTLTIFLVNEDVMAVQVDYGGSERDVKPLFKTLIPDLKKDDLVVVPTGTRAGFTVAKVVDVDVDFDHEDPTMKMRWIAGRFDREPYDGVVAQEEDMLRTVKRATRKAKQRQLAKDLKLDKEELKALPITTINGDDKKD